MLIEKNEFLDDEIAVFAIEVPKKEHGKKEVLEAKQREIENLQKFGSCEEIEDDIKDNLTSTWVIMDRMKHDC